MFFFVKQQKNHLAKYMQLAVKWKVDEDKLLLEDAKRCTVIAKRLLGVHMFFLPCITWSLGQVFSLNYNNVSVKYIRQPNAYRIVYVCSLPSTLPNV